MTRPQYQRNYTAMEGLNRRCLRSPTTVPHEIRTGRLIGAEQIDQRMTIPGEANLRPGWNVIGRDASLAVLAILHCSYRSMRLRAGCVPHFGVEADKMAPGAI